MEKEDRAVRGIVRSDIDAQGNVVLWDHGPTEPGPEVERDGDEFKRLEAEDKAWHLKNGDGPIAVTMAQSDAVHAMSVEPYRYSLDPADVSDSDVEDEIKKIQDQRLEAEKVTQDRADAVQYAIDRRTAVATVMANRRAADLEAKAPKPPQPQPTDEPVVSLVPKPVVVPPQPSAPIVAQPQPVVIPPQPQPLLPGNV